MSLTIKKIDEETPVLVLEGRLDTITAPELEKEISELSDEVNGLVIDMEKLEYVSSAGLRVILKAYKALSSKDGLKIINASDDIKEVFNITGFSDFLNIE